jgi:hypothetical protein
MVPPRRWRPRGIIARGRWRGCRRRPCIGGGIVPHDGSRRGCQTQQAGGVFRPRIMLCFSLHSGATPLFSPCSLPSTFYLSIFLPCCDCARSFRGRPVDTCDCAAMVDRAVVEMVERDDGQLKEPPVPSFRSSPSRFRVRAPLPAPPTSLHFTSLHFTSLQCIINSSTSSHFVTSHCMQEVREHFPLSSMLHSLIVHLFLSTLLY